MASGVSPGTLRFADFELAPDNASLTRAGEPIALTPRAFALLCALASQPGQLARKEALLDAVWGHRHISESVLKATVNKVRAALGDDPKQPRYIETVSRHGYRFIATVTHVTPRAPPERRAAPSLVGRRAALETLHARWRRASAGARELVWIAGDAGVGKTTLIDAFVAASGAEVVGYGQCAEQFGSGEPYLPVLEALKPLTRQDPKLVALLRSHAPTWLAQMPWLLADADRAALQAGFAGTGQERMIRELAEAVEQYTRERPLLLVTEDLHWSDQATLRLMEHFARHRTNEARVLWIASFRLAQVVAEQHPLQALRQELQLHRLCTEIILDPFSEAEVAECVARHFAASGAPDDFVLRLHAHTDGLPLFVANVLDDLFPRDVEVPAGIDALPAAAGSQLPLPANLAGVVERQLQRLDALSRDVLIAASVCGVEFSAGAVAAALGVDITAAVDRCTELASKHYWLRPVGLGDLGDETLDARFAFRHALYRHVLYGDLAPGRCVQLHRRIAAHLAARSAAGHAVVAAELALHHELGRQHPQAVECYAAAAERAQESFAPHEAVDLTTRALALLPACPSDRREPLELRVRAARGNAFGTIEGISSERSTSEFERVRALYDALPQTPERARLLNGVGWAYYVRGEFESTLAIGRRLLAVAETCGDALLLVFGSNLIGVTYATMGQLAAAVASLERGLEAWQHARPKATVWLVDPETSMRANLALPLILLGRYDEGLRESAHAVARAEAVGQPLARMLAAWCGCLVAARLDRPDLVAEHARALADVVAAAGVGQGLGPATWFKGWLEIRAGELAEGHAKVRRGYALHERFGMYAGCSEILGYAVEARIEQRAWDDAQRELDEAFSVAARIGERHVLPELLTLGARIAAGRGDVAGERRALEAACAEAEAAGALGSLLKVRTALAATAAAEPRDRAALAAVLQHFPAGVDAPPVTRARRVLAAA